MSYWSIICLRINSCCKCCGTVAKFIKRLALASRSIDNHWLLKIFLSWGVNRNNFYNRCRLLILQLHLHLAVRKFLFYLATALIIFNTNCAFGCKAAWCLNYQTWWLLFYGETCSCSTALNEIFWYNNFLGLVLIIRIYCTLSRMILSLQLQLIKLLFRISQ
jgi:hypothetical protein